MILPVTLDLTQRHFSKRRGDLTVIGTWVQLAEGWQPCLAIIRAGEEKSEHTWPCVITMSKAWVFEESVGDPRLAARILHSFIGPLRLTDEPKTLIFLAGLMHDLLDDLLKIPPHVQDTSKAVELGDLTITDNRTGRTIVETVLTDV